MTGGPPLSFGDAKLCVPVQTGLRRMGQVRPRIILTMPADNLPWLPPAVC